MSDLRDLFQEVILEHYKHPRNKGIVPNATHAADGHNTLCGDQVHVSLHLDDKTIDDIRFEGVGCAICSASASIMTEMVKEHTLEEVQTMYARFHDLATGKLDPMLADPDELGKMAVFSGVSQYPARVKCATLPWHTLDAALQGSDEPVTTE